MKIIFKDTFVKRLEQQIDDIQIRDLIFKGYTIVFRFGSDSIEVFGFVNFQNSPTD